MTLSIIIPVFNEERTIVKVLSTVNRLVIPGVKKEIIIVNDGSTDASASKILNFQFSILNFKVITHKKNLGKGAAIRSGIKVATGEYIVVQDADLEYNPQDIKKFIDVIVKGKAEVVYGTRLKRLPNFKKDERKFRFFVHYLGNKALSLLASVLYGQWITDMETGYKIIPRAALLDLQLEARGFEFEPEITAKLLKKGYTISEVSISTNPRSYNEGKKLDTIKDGVKAFYTLVRYRFFE